MARASIASTPPGAGSTPCTQGRTDALSQVHRWGVRWAVPEPFLFADCGRPSSGAGASGVGRRTVAAVLRHPVEVEEVSWRS